MQYLKKTGIGWLERTLLSKLYMDQWVKIGLGQRETSSVKTEEGLDRYAVCHQFYSTYTANTLPTKLLKG
jgi:hypothetical protein